MCAPGSVALFSQQLSLYGQWLNYQPNVKTVKPIAKRGRKPKYDWEAGRLHIKDLFEYHGSLSPDDENWSCQADIERALQDFFQKLIGQSPATSTVRTYARKYMNEFMDNNSDT